VFERQPHALAWPLYKSKLNYQCPSVADLSKRLFIWDVLVKRWAFAGFGFRAWLPKQNYKAPTASGPSV
jgi:hypothetical protein